MAVLALAPGAVEREESDDLVDGSTGGVPMFSGAAAAPRKATSIIWGGTCHVARYGQIDDMLREIRTIVMQRREHDIS